MKVLSIVLYVLLILLYVLCLPLIIIVNVGRHLIRGWIEHRHNARIWCMCEVNRRIGFVVREDYDAASKKYWQTDQTRSGYRNRDFGHIAAHDGRLLDIDPGKVIVIDIRTKEGRDKFHTLAYGRLLERRLFRVPDQETPMEEAYLRIKGRPWQGQYINW
jgi:hypothetical protein